MDDTEIRLKFWQYNQTASERLAATALALYGFSSLDPQSPLGGPDGGKDILALKGGRKWSAAVYFPIAPVTFTTVKRKFCSDLEKSPTDFQGFVFVTNQNITPTQRKSLQDLCKGKKSDFELLHLQSLLALLNSTPGYAARLRFLSVPLTKEEQLAWITESEFRSARSIDSINTRLSTITQNLDRIASGQSLIMRTMAIAEPSLPPTPDLLAMSRFVQEGGKEKLTAHMSIELIRLLHRMSCYDVPTRIVGQIRTSTVWLGGISLESALYVPPASELIPKLLNDLCLKWNAAFDGLGSKEDRLRAIAEFHFGFLKIHPFLDGNGRVSISILMQQCLDLFGIADLALLERGTAYYEALWRHDGDIEVLVRLIRPVVER